MVQVRGKSETLSVMLAQTTAAQVLDRTKKKMVGRDGIEPPTPGFSVLCSTN